MEMKPYIVYVKTNSNGYVTTINSSAFLTDTTGWVEIDSGYGDKHHHAQGNYFEKSILTDSGVYRYKLVNENVIECTEEEIRIQEEANKTNEPITNSLEYRVSILENKVDNKISEYEESLQELGVEI